MVIFGVCYSDISTRKYSDISIRKYSDISTRKYSDISTRKYLLQRFTVYSVHIYITYWYPNSLL